LDLQYPLGREGELVVRGGKRPDNTALNSPNRVDKKKKGGGIAIDEKGRWIDA